MNPTDQVCDNNQIDEYLEERMSQADLAEFESHLSSCDRCQIEIQRRAAEPEVWSDAVALLADRSDGAGVATDDEHEPGRASHALSVLDSLAPSDDPEMLGRIGDYGVSAVVGVGGMGAVLKGFDKSLRRVVAIKVMAPHLADSGSARTRFQREARAAAAITHDNVIDTYGVSEANGLPYLVMPFARGPSLQRRIDESGPLTALEVVRIGRQIASGLAAAHEQGLIHRDIKPANILLNEGIERLWITDFGVARAMDDASMTQTGVIAGTPQYMSPEQARGEAVDPRSDLFSLGSVLYTACTGRPPFRSEAAYGILRRITDTDPRPIREITPDIPPWLCGVIERLMAKHPADRYQSAGEVAELLEGCLAHLQQPTLVELPPCVASPKNTNELVVRKETLSDKPGKKRNAAPSSAGWRRRALWGTVSLLALVGIGLAAFQMTGPADIAGHWTGEQWKSVSLSTVEEASGWYTGSFMTSEGRRGALQLEWSRLQRCYNGRWKMGADTSGSVVLRSRGAELRGAVSVDPESRFPANRARLRELSWRRAPAGAVGGMSRDLLGQVSESEIVIQSPVAGRIVRWGAGIAEQARVEMGDLIAEIAQIDQRPGAAAQNAVVTQDQIVAKEKELLVLEVKLTSLQSNLRDFEKNASRVAKAAKTTLDLARVNVKAAEAELAEAKALLRQAAFDFDRQKKLYDKGVGSETEAVHANQSREQAEARVAKAEAALEAAKLNVIATQDEGEGNQEQASARLEDVKVQLARAKTEQVKVEKELAEAKMALASQGNAGAVAIQPTRRIFAPTAGTVAKLVSGGPLKPGDVICVLQMEVAATLESSATDLPAQLQSTSPGALPMSIPMRPPSSLSGLSTTETLDEARVLAARLRQIEARLQAINPGDTGAQNSEVIQQLKRERDAAVLKSKAAVAILEAKLAAAQQLLDSQTKLSSALQRQVDSGETPPLSLLPAQQAVAQTEAEKRQLELLLDHYGKLQKSGVTREEDQNVVLSLLEAQLQGARTRHRIQAELSGAARLLFENGDSGVEPLLKAEQDEAQMVAEVRRLETLLDYQRKVGPLASDSALPVPLESLPVEAEADELEEDALFRPQTKSERVAIAKVFSARLEAATAKMEQKQRDLDRMRRAYERGLISDRSHEVAQVAAKEAEAIVKELKAKIEFYESPR